MIYLLISFVLFGNLITLYIHLHEKFKFHLFRFYRISIFMSLKPATNIL